MPTDHTVSLHGSTFHYTEQGDRQAPAVLMLHGITGHARTWDDEGAALAARHRVLALDQRGHGDSDPPADADYTIASLAGDVAAFADALALGTFTIVGLSLGGRVGIQYAGTHPGRVRRLVVIDIGPDIAPAGRMRVGGADGGRPRAIRLRGRGARLPAREQPALHGGDAAAPDGAWAASAARRRLHVEVRSRPARARAQRAHGAIPSTSGRRGARSTVRRSWSGAPSPTS